MRLLHIKFVVFSRLPKGYCLSFHAMLLMILAQLVFSTSLASIEVMDPPQHWNRGSIGISASTMYFSSQANYLDDRDSYQGLAGDNSFTTFESQFRGRLGVTPRWSIFAGFGFAYARAIDPGHEHTNGAITDVNAGAQLKISGKRLRLIPEIQIGYPLDKFETDTRVPLTSDGAAYARTILHAQIPLRRLSLLGHIGAHVPAEGLSKRLLFGFGAELSLGKRFDLGIGVRGYETIISDELTYTERVRVTDRVNAGSYRFYSFDPALLEGRAWAGFQPDPSILMKIAYGQTINGIRSANGQSIHFFIEFNTKGRTKADNANNWRELRRKQRAKAMKQFEAQTEEVDPEFFEADDFSEPPSSPQILRETEDLIEQRGR